MIRARFELSYTLNKFFGDRAVDLRYFIESIAFWNRPHLIYYV